MMHELNRTLAASLAAVDDGDGSISSSWFAWILDFGFWIMYFVDDVDLWIFGSLDLSTIGIPGQLGVR